MNILILCTGNSCRSVMAEVLFNDLSNGSVQAFSAGSQPAGTVNPRAIDKLQSTGHSANGLRSKSWDEFGHDDAPTFDIVLTVCDSASREACPVWHGSPVRAHWSLPDPADAPDAEANAAFNRTYQQLRRRVEDTLQLPLTSMDTRNLTDALHRIHDAACVAERLAGD